MPRSKQNENARRAGKRNLAQEIRDARDEMVRAELRVTTAQNGLKRAQERLAALVDLKAGKEA